MHENAPLSGHVTVLRLGHRPGRDDRMTTHVALTARALGAERALLVGDTTGARDTVRDITDRFGGPFVVEAVDEWRPLVREWEGNVVHLTMYGERVQDVEREIRASVVDSEDPLLVVVGSQKVPFEVYDAADWNVAVTNQPHSEVAGLAVFLDRLFEGRELSREWDDADKRVVPMETGKRVVDAASETVEE
ncbi:tRNA (cytidine(56)-2'-O)-methyltransferase [Salinigranum rubrum]|uniref:tRNA (cytidine(56)-2'-O)-methyltransferase n=1 Tax=Salinigranum rubrum TaxID=755307 RepID=A0A2I8VHU5_9EURY|nr:tRNA (cytidine(56)-2'-O)-methyltransferase [Salinigranum rubrum]AUV81513.1 tRNA (cytidine(56)-2'-O)-methyltransferase [Salinigranum rubrum]